MKFLKFIFLFIVYSNFCFGQNLDSLYVSKINDTIASKILSEKGLNLHPLEMSGYQAPAFSGISFRDGIFEMFQDFSCDQFGDF